MNRRLLGLIGIILCAQVPAGADVAISNVTVIDGRGGAPLPDVTVIVRNGRISEIRRGTTPVKGLQIIDGSHRYLVPGFIDMHAHLLVPRCSGPDRVPLFDRQLSERMLSQLLDFGITTIRSPATPTIDGLKLRDDLNAGRVRGPTAAAPAELINDSFLGDQDLRNYVRDALRYRPGYFKVYAGLRPEQVASVIDEAHRHKIPVIGHLQRTSWAEGTRLSIDHLCHAADWSEKTLRPDRRGTYAEAQRKRGAMRARLDWIEFLDLESPEVTEMIAALVRFAGLLPELRNDWETCETTTNDWTADDYARWKKDFPKLQRLIRLMHERGVLLTTGSDLTNPWVIPGEGLHQEFAFLQGAGLGAHAALRMTGKMLRMRSAEMTLVSSSLGARRTSCCCRQTRWRTLRTVAASCGS